MVIVGRYDAVASTFNWGNLLRLNWIRNSDSTSDERLSFKIPSWARPGCWHPSYNTAVSNSHLIDQPVILIRHMFIGWHHAIGAKFYNLGQSGQIGGQNSMNKAESGPDWQSPVFCTVLTAVMMQIALTGRVLRPIPRYSSLTGKQLFKER
jgi:hypothetical protein